MNENPNNETPWNEREFNPEELQALAEMFLAQDWGILNETDLDRLCEERGEARVYLKHPNTNPHGI
jgi:hypothetical protein